LPRFAPTRDLNGAELIPVHNGDGTMTTASDLLPMSLTFSAFLVWQGGWQNLSANCQGFRGAGNCPASLPFSLPHAISTDAEFVPVHNRDGSRDSDVWQD